MPWELITSTQWWPVEPWVNLWFACTKVIRLDYPKFLFLGIRSLRWPYANAFGIRAMLRLQHLVLFTWSRHDMETFPALLARTAMFWFLTVRLHEMLNQTSKSFSLGHHAAPLTSRQYIYGDWAWSSMAITTVLQMANRGFRIDYS